MGRKTPTLDERLSQPKAHIKQLTTIIRSIKQMKREGGYCDEDLEKMNEELIRIREIYKTTVKLYELKDAG